MGTPAPKTSRPRAGWRGFGLFLTLLCTTSLAACGFTGAVGAETPPPTTPPAPTTTLTPVWFPVTPTSTLRPVEIPPTATPAPLEGLGPVILKDDFAPNGQWITYQNDSGSVQYGKNELTLAVNQPKASLVSLREQPPLENYYLEITATPSLCQGSDQFGVMFRVVSTRDFYRLVVTCGAQVRLEKVQNAAGTILQDWTFSPQLTPDSPNGMRLGILAAGSLLRIYINQVLQFEARDPAFTVGGLGVFARSQGQNVETINFSDLLVRFTTPTALPSLTPTPSS